MLLRDDPSTLQTLHRLRALGVRIALDDFGTAFASLSYLRSFPFDTIKIDRSFVREVPQRADCAAIIEAMAGLAKKLQMSTVAEGIETQQQAIGRRESRAAINCRASCSAGRCRRPRSPSCCGRPRQRADRRGRMRDGQLIARFAAFDHGDLLIADTGLSCGGRSRLP